MFQFRETREDIMRILIAALLAALTAPGAGAAQQTTARPYVLEDIVVLLQGGHSTERILARVQSDCISFRVDAAAATLTRAGADQALISGLRGVCYRAPARAPAPAARDSGVVRIEGELPPGWWRSVNELPPSTNRQISMTPGRRNMVLVGAPGWCSDVIEIAVRAGEQRSWTPALRPRPWVGGCDAEGW
jgi:hypothetical protein